LDYSTALGELGVPLLIGYKLHVAVLIIRQMHARQYAGSALEPLFKYSVMPRINGVYQFTLNLTVILALSVFSVTKTVTVAHRVTVPTEMLCEKR
jgi:hypothetical protein